MAGKLKPLDMILRAVDRATGPFQAINERIERMNAPVRALGGAFTRLGKEARLPQVATAISAVGREVGALARSASALALGGGVLGVGVVAGFQKFLSYGDDIGAVSARLKVSAEELQEWRYAADRLGDVDAGDFDAGMRKLQKSITLIAANKGPAALVAQRLEQISGIKIFDPKGANALPAFLARYSNALAQVKDQNVAARMTEIIMGTGSENMVSFLQQGSARIDEFRQRARSLGVVLDSSTVEAADSAGNKFKDLGDVVKTLAFTVMGDLLPSLLPLVEEMTVWVQTNREWIRNDLGPQLADLIRGAANLARQIPVVVNAVGGLGNAAMIVAAFLSRNLIVSVVRLAWAAGGLAFRAIWSLSGVIGTVSRALMIAGRVAFPIVVAGLRMIAVAALANPLGAIVVAVNLLIAAGTLLYFKWKPFRDMIDGLVEAVKYAGSYWFGGDAAPAAAPSAGPADPAAVARGGSTRVGGRVDVQVRAEQGSAAQVTQVQTANRDVPVGAIMAGAY